MIPFVYLTVGALYGALVVLVAIAIGKSIKAGQGGEPLPDPVEDAGVDLMPDHVEPDAAPSHFESDVLGGQPAEVLSNAEINARFRQIIQPEFTWETWL